MFLQRWFRIPPNPGWCHRRAARRGASLPDIARYANHGESAEPVQRNREKVYILSLFWLSKSY